MARVSSSTQSLDARARSTGKPLVVTERTWYRARIVNGRLVRTPLHAELKDTAGLAYERVSEWSLRCLSTGEDVDVQGIAPSIRPGVKLR